MKIQQADGVWRNWSGSQSSAAQIFQPSLISELQGLVKTHAHIRAVGAGHSFSPLAKTDEILLNLDQFKGIVAFDQEKTQCTVQAGTRLYDLGEYLAPINQALPNQSGPAQSGGY
jgi:L-gulonolactone oxidase